MLPNEVERAYKIKVAEVNVFGEPPVVDAGLRKKNLREAFKPTRAFPGAFGAREAIYEDGPTRLYLARFRGDGFALLGERPRLGDRAVVLKIGISNDVTRRLGELNAGFPPAALGRWEITTLSEPYERRQAAEEAENAFKRSAVTKLRSFGGEFFIGDWTSAEVMFAQVPGVSRFAP